MPALMDDGTIPPNNDPDVVTNLGMEDTSVCHVRVTLKPKDGSEPAPGSEAALVRRFKYNRRSDAHEFIKALNPPKEFGSEIQNAALKAKFLHMQSHESLLTHTIVAEIEEDNAVRAAPGAEPNYFDKPKATLSADEVDALAEDDPVDTFDSLPAADEDEQEEPATDEEILESSEDEDDVASDEEPESEEE